jgi:Protein of unknown function (DUF3046)
MPVPALRRAPRGQAAATAGGCDAGCDDGAVRLTDFWERMEETFGRTYARSWADDQHLAALGGRTVTQALSEGIDTRDVWRAVCLHAQVPAHLR